MFVKFNGAAKYSNRFTIPGFKKSLFNGGQGMKITEKMDVDQGGKYASRQKYKVV